MFLHSSKQKSICRPTLDKKFIRVRGSTTVTAETLGQQARLPLIVANGSGPSLLGRDWLAKLRLD